MVLAKQWVCTIQHRFFCKKERKREKFGSFVYHGWQQENAPYDRLMMCLALVGHFVLSPYKGDRQREQNRGKP